MKPQTRGPGRSCAEVALASSEKPSSLPDRASRVVLFSLNTRSKQEAPRSHPGCFLGMQTVHRLFPTAPLGEQEFPTQKRTPYPEISNPSKNTHIDLAKKFPNDQKHLKYAGIFFIPRLHGLIISSFEPSIQTKAAF